MEKTEEFSKQAGLSLLAAIRQVLKGENKRVDFGTENYSVKVYHLDHNTPVRVDIRPVK